MLIYVIVAAIGLFALSSFIYYFGKRRGEKNKLNDVVEKLSGDMAERVIHSIPDMIFIVDANYKIRRILNSDPKKLSAPLEAVIGKSLHDAVDIEYTVPVLKGVQKALSSDEVQEVEYAMSFGEETQFFEGRFKRIQKGLVACFERNITERRRTEGELIKYQEQLQEANHQLHIAFSVTSSVPIIWNLETDIISFKFSDFKKESDDFFKERNGIPANEVLTYLHPDEREDTARLLEDIRNGRKDTIHKEVRYDITGKYEHFYEIYMTLEKRSEEGKPYRVVGTMRNITERKIYEKSIVTAKKNLEEAQRVKKLILDNANCGLVYINSDFVVEWENVARFEEFPVASKYKPGVVCYKSVMGLDEPCSGCVARQALISGKIEQTEMPLDGNTIAITASPVYAEDGKKGVVLKYDDITASKKTAEELKRAKEAAETSDKLKSMFISNMSHEIRTPLNAIVGFSELLIHTEDIGEKEEYMSVIKRNNELLLQLINDILDLSKIEAETLEFVYSNVDINDMFRNMELSSNQKITEDSELSIVFTPALENCIIYTEKNRVQQVVLNLINNALKFTEKGIINIGYELKENGFKFFVSDTGCGIPQEKLNEIFKRFVKLDNFISGTGLGLSICQTIINKLGGEIGVESVEGEGSTFWFTLPVKPVTVKQIVKENSTEDESPTLYITNRGDIKDTPILLIAEDAVDNFKLYNTLLGKKYELLHAWNGKEAVDIYEQNKDKIDLIIMDIKMPEMDGYEATELIRRNAPDIPIIAASAYAFSEDVARIMNSGFNDYISKPINKTALMTALDNFLK